MIIHAVSIHSGGGKVLLDHLITSNIFGNVKILICDSRYSPPKNAPDSIKIYKINATIFSRWCAEVKLFLISSKNPKEEILCFANLPPAFKLKNKVILYLQNALLIPSTPILESSLVTRLRLLYEKIWLKFFIKNTDEIWVQSSWMIRNLQTHFPEKKIFLKPFLPKLPKLERTEVIYDFITVTGCAAHKRLKQLLEAWSEYPTTSPPKLMVITDQPTKEILELLTKLKDKNVEYRVNICREELFDIYSKSKNLILTSKIESFCLPIFEAMHFHLNIYGIREDFNSEYIQPQNYLEFKNEKISLDKIMNSL